MSSSFSSTAAAAAWAAERAALLKSAGYEPGSLGPPELVEREVWAACAWVARPLAENQAAAEAGDAAAQDAMGRRFFKGVSPDGPEGPMNREAVVMCATWFRKAADRPDPNISSMSMLGSMLAAREFSGQPGPLSQGIGAAPAAWKPIIRGRVRLRPAALYSLKPIQ